MSNWVYLRRIKISGVIIDKLPHQCGTRRGLNVYAQPETGKVNGYCYACGEFVANPYGKPKTVDEVELPKKKTPEEIAAEMAEIDGYPTVDLRSRKLRASDLDYLGIKVALSEKDGKTPTAAFCPVTKGGKITGYYAKPLIEGGSQWAVGDVRDGDLIGWEEAKKSGAYRLIITEGWFDAIAVNKIYKLYGNDDDYHPAIVSLPNGTDSTKAIAAKSSEIRSLFKEIVFCFDDDKAGRKAVEKAMLILPEALSVTLPCTDANDCVLEGRMKAAYKSLAFRAEKPKNTRLISGFDIHDVAREPTPYGELTWPFPTLNKLLRNVRLGETIYIGAGVKMGKSELANALAAHHIKVDGVPVLMAKPEEENKDTYKRVAGKIEGKVFHDPDVDFDYEAFDRAGEVLKPKIYLIDLYQHLGWETLKADIIAAANQGVKAVFIDPITNLTNGLQAGEANSQLQEIAQDLSAMALDLNIVIYIFCHLRAPEGNLGKDSRMMKYKKGQYYNLGNCPHELGGDVLSNQFAGSRAMMRSCNLMLGLAGNKDSELEDEIKRMRWITILEDRGFGNSASIPIIWSPVTQLYTEC